MKRTLFLGTVCISPYLLAQGGWVKDTNPANDITYYSTTYPYAGCSFIEINGDGFVDLYAAPKTLFLNNTDGTFTEISSLPFTELISTSGSSYADLDNDGDNDIIVACVPSKIYFNQGDETFSDSSSQVPSFFLYGSWAVAIGDYNMDRELDFIFSHANGLHPPSSPSPCKFFKQQSPIFAPLNVQLSPVTDSLDSYTNPYWSDYDLDGDMDLFMASGPVSGAAHFDYCYKNLKMETGADSLVHITGELFASQMQDGQCYNFIDYDNDGDLDLCITNYNGAPTRLYQNNDSIYVSISTPFTTTTTNMANCWGDYDNDGDLDVIITNDHEITRYYRNDGGATFTYLATGFSTPTATNGITNGDYDNDGDLDIFTNGVGNNGSPNSVGLYINDTVAGNRAFINLHLVGTVSNRSAIGAIVRLKTTIYGNPVWQMREINAQNTFQGQNDLRVHFGLGNAVTIDSIIINWPSGDRDTLTNYPVNSFYRITEGVGGTNLSMDDQNILHNQVAIFPNPATDHLQVRLYSQDTDLNYELLDVQGRVIRSDKMGSDLPMISVQSLLPGIYFIRIRGENTDVTKKFIRK